MGFNIYNGIELQMENVLRPKGLFIILEYVIFESCEIISK